LSQEEFRQHLNDFRQEAVHLETRDAYGTAVELPYMAKWAAGERDDLEWLQGWCSTIRTGRLAGKVYRRARIVSEPLSEYQRWSYSIACPMVEAGEDIRWVPRQLISGLAIPGNDFYLLDDRLVIFLHYTGSGLSAGITSSADPGHIELCRSSFEAVWKLAIPHREYAPV
jgi:hypothetical protein